MILQLSRLRADLRSVGIWVVILAMISFAASFVAYWMSAVAYESSQSGSLSLEPPAKPLSFVRVYDPTESFIQQAETRGDTSVADSVAVQEMFKYASRNTQAYFVMSLSALGGSLMTSSGESIDGHIIVGRPPNLSDEPAHEHSVLLFGTLPKDTVSSHADRIGQLPITQVSPQPLDINVVDGQGYLDSLSDTPTIVVDAEDAALLGIQAPYQPADVAESMVCHCSTDQLDALTKRMTSLQDSTGGSSDGYIAVGYNDLIGPLQRAAAAGSAINQIFIAAILLLVVCFALSATHLLCARRIKAFRGELLVGSPMRPIQLRLFFLTTSALTLPLLAGGAISRISVADSVSPGPLPVLGDCAYAIAVITFGIIASAYSARVLRAALTGR